MTATRLNTDADVEQTKESKRAKCASHNSVAVALKACEQTAIEIKAASTLGQNNTKRNSIKYCNGVTARTDAMRRDAAGADIHGRVRFQKEEIMSFLNSIAALLRIIIAKCINCS